MAKLMTATTRTTNAQPALTPTIFRLSPETIADLDLIAAHHQSTTGARTSRTDALRIAAKMGAEKIRGNSKNND